MAAIRALFWGNRVGKTEWGAQEVARYLLADHPYRDVSGHVEIWAACPSYDAQEETTQPKLLKYIPEDQIAHRDHIRGKILKKLVLKNGNFITFKSYEQGREKFQGAGKRLIWFDEEPPKDIWEECFVRVEAGVQLDVILTMTAIKGMTWVYDEIYLDTSNEDLYVSEAGWDDNPWLTEKQKEQMARGLSPQALKVRREGKFTKRVGLICNWWDRTIHLQDYTSYPQTWEWYEVLDGGWNDPAAYLLIGVDNYGQIHVRDGFREKYLKEEDMVERRDLITAGLRIKESWIDPNPRLQSSLSALGWHFSPVIKKSGDAANIDEFLAEKLAQYGQKNIVGYPSLYISSGITRVNDKGNAENWLVQEIENLVWKERSSKKGEEIVPEWDDHRRFKHHFDGMRALGYFLMMFDPDIDAGVVSPTPRKPSSTDELIAASLKANARSRTRT